MYRDNNDYYLIYLIKTGHEEAFDYLLHKYRFIFWTIVHTYSLPEYMKSEICQDLLSMLYPLVERYDDTKGRFSTYCTVAAKRTITRRYIKVIKERKNNIKYFEVYKDEFYSLNDSTLQKEEIVDFYKKHLSEVEMEIFKRQNIYHQSTKFICKKLNVNSVKVYNTNQIVKDLAKKHLDINDYFNRY